jgi:hypothetical protein
MKKYFFLLMITLALKSAHVFAQNHFIYIQSESRQPFTVSVNDKDFTSTVAGYVIIPRLKNGEYDLIVKYNNDKTKGVRFTSVIDKKDLGYTLKDLGNNTAGLVNMQTYATLAAAPFDSYAKNDEKTANDKAEVDKNSSTAKTNTTQKGGAKKPVVKKDSNPPSTVTKLKSGINKISEVQQAGNLSMIFVDVQGKTLDTIDVVIPTVKKGTSKSIYEPSADNSLFKWASAKYSNDEDLLNVDWQEGYNNKCVHLLTKEDYARLRRRMAAETNEDKMINEALKVSNTKCFTTLQVKHLSALFPKDQGKYKLFSALYSFVYDYIDYPVLEKELTDTAYVSKLQSILRK